jgi:hypothetical protein
MATAAEIHVVLTITVRYDTLLKKDVEDKYQYDGDWYSPSHIRERGTWPLMDYGFEPASKDQKLLPEKMGDSMHKNEAPSKAQWRAMLTIEDNKGRTFDWFDGGTRLSGRLYQKAHWGDRALCLSFARFSVKVHEGRNGKSPYGILFNHDSDRLAAQSVLSPLLAAFESVGEARQRKRMAEEQLETYLPAQRLRLEKELAEVIRRTKAEQEFLVLEADDIIEVKEAKLADLFDDFFD